MACLTHRTEWKITQHRHGVEKALRRPYNSFPVPKGPVEKLGRDSLLGGVGIGHGVMALNLKRGDLD